MTKFLVSSSGMTVAITMTLIWRSFLILVAALNSNFSIKYQWTLKGEGMDFICFGALLRPKIFFDFF